MAYVHIDPAAIEAILHSPTGPVMRIVGLTAEAIKDVAIGNIHSVTGELAESGSVEILPGHAVVKFDSDHAAATEFGSRAHEIVPRNARVLRFQSGGATVFAMRTSHPGTPAQHFLLKAALAVAAAPIA